MCKSTFINCHQISVPSITWLVSGILFYGNAFDWTKIPREYYYKPIYMLKTFAFGGVFYFMIRVFLLLIGLCVLPRLRSVQRSEPYFVVADKFFCNLNSHRLAGFNFLAKVLQTCQEKEWTPIHQILVHPNNFHISIFSLSFLLKY